MTESPPGTLPSVLRAAAERHPDRPAYVDGDRAVSFTELLALVQATARGFAGLGLSAGDRLVLWAPNSIDWVVAALATSYAGGTLVPANSRYTAHEVFGFPLWMGIATTTFLPAVWTTRWKRLRRRQSVDLCPTCGYDLRASPDRCPECGAVPESARTATAEAAAVE